MHLMNVRQTCETLGLLKPRLYTLVNRGLVRPTQVGDHRIAFSERDVLIAKTVVQLIDAGVPHYAVRAVAERINRIDDAEAVRAYAAGLTLFKERDTWHVCDSNLDPTAREALNARVEAGEITCIVEVLAE